MNAPNDFPALVLPKRFEALRREAAAREVDISRIVSRVDDAATRVEDLLRQVRDGGLGRFEVFLGKSGSGKTTFFSTLTKFFTGAVVHEIPKSVPIGDIAAYIERHNTDDGHSIWFIHDRDNPELTSSEARHFCESLRPLFRSDKGRVLLIWPITSGEVARMLAVAAWEIGRESIVDVNSKGLFQFHGLDRSQYYEIADLTVSSLIPSNTLETFGLTRDETKPLITSSETIGEFYSRLEARSLEINKRYRDVLKDRVIPRVWVVVAGDSNPDLGNTVNSLTSGRVRQIDIGSILSFLDEEGEDRAYMRDWKRRRSDAALLLKRLDVRVFELPANAALAAVRVFGDEASKKTLKLKSARKAQAIEALSKTSLVRANEGDEALGRPTTRQTENETADEFRRLQNISAKKDHRLNNALSAALKETLSSEKIISVIAERQLESGKLRPDVAVETAAAELICLEITWRTTGKAVQGEIDARQNTLSAGHIQKYVLEKAMEYVKELGL